MAIELKSFNQILGDMLRKIIAETPLNDVNAGSVLLSLLEACASGDFENNVAILNVLELLNIDAIRNNDLDARAGDYGLKRNTSTKASGQVTIFNTNIVKRSTSLYVIKPAPISGQTTLYVNTTTGWSPTGTLYIGRGTESFEGPIAYTAIAVFPTYSQITLGAALQKDHLISDIVIDSQGEPDRLIASGTVVKIPANNQNPEITYTTLRDAVIAAGEDNIAGVDVIAIVPGSIGNAQINTVTQFETLPFVGAAISNTSSFSNGDDVETDVQLRNRIKSYSITLARGTAPAIVSAVIGISDPDDSKQVASAIITEPVKVGDPSILYIDDGSGFQPSYTGQSVDKMLANANGTEEFLQLANFPVTRPQAVNVVEGPFSITDSMFMRVAVDGTEETIVLSSSQFQNISAATSAEIIVAINDQSTLFKARFTNNSANILLYPVAHDAEIIQVIPLRETDTVALYANSILKFPTNEFSYIALYQNSTRLREKEKTATIETIAFASWNVTSTGNLIIAVDDTPAQDSTFVLSDFPGASSFTGLSLEDWVNAFNTKYAGIAAEATPGQTMKISSNKSGSNSSLAISGGTYLNKLLPNQVTTAVGQTSQFELNRQTGNIRVLTDIVENDTISAGVEDAKGFSVSTATTSGTYNVSNDAFGRPAEVIIVIDSSECTPRSVPLVVGATVTISDEGSSVMRILSSTLDAFVTLQPGDFIYMVRRTVGWLSNANAGLYKIVSKGSHLSANVDSYVEVLNDTIVAETVSIADSTDIKAFSTDGYPQIWRGQYATNPPAETISNLVASINASILGIRASIFRSNSIKLTSVTELNGSIAIPVVVGTAAAIFTETSEAQFGNPPHIANRVSDKSLFGTFRRTVATAVNVWLNRHIYTDIKGPLSANAVPDVPPYSATYSEIVAASGVLTPTNVGYPDILSFTRGNNRHLFKPIKAKIATDSVGTQQGTPRTEFDHIVEDEIQLMDSLKFAADDSIVFILDKDVATKTVDIKISRTGQVNSGSNALSFLPTTTELSANDVDNEPGIDFSNANVWSTSINKTKFDDYAMLMRARNWYSTGGVAGIGGKMIVRSFAYGTSGEKLRFSLRYPETPDQLSTTVLQNTPSWSLFSYFFGSQADRAIALSTSDTISVLGPYPDNSTNFPNGVTSSGNYFDYTFSGGNFASVQVGDILSIQTGAGVGIFNSGSFRVAAKSGNTLRLFNTSASSTSPGSPEVSTFTTIADAVGTPSTVTITTLAAPAPGSPNLASAATYTVIASSTITNTGSSVLTGDLGLYPGTSVTGFPPGTVSGTQHITDTAAQQAQADALAAYTYMQGLAPGTIVGALGGLTLGPGTYTSLSSMSLTGTLTLDGGGDPDAVWIFQLGSTLTTASSSVVSLINSAQAKNVYWQVGSSATLGTSSTFKGTIIAQASVTATTSTNIVEGRLFALTAAVTLDTNMITAPSVGPPAALDGSYFTMFDNAGSVKVWFDVNNDGTPEPVSAPHNRTIKISTIVTGDSSAIIASKIAAYLSNDVAFTNIFNTSVQVIFNLAQNGPVATPVDGTPPAGFSFSVASGIADVSLDGEYFIVYDDVGSVAVWFDVGNDGTPEPFHGADRSIRVGTINYGDSANTVAAAIASVVNPDAKFNAVAATNQLTITTTFNANTTNAAVGTSGFSVVTTPGSLSAAEIITNPAQIHIFPLSGTTVQEIVDKVNEKNILKAAVIGVGSLTIEKSTEEDDYAYGGNSTALGYGHNPTSSTERDHISLFDGINWVKTFANTNPNFILKQILTLNGVAPSVYQMNTAPNDDATTGEYFKLVPTTVKNVQHHLTQKALSQLPIISTVDVSNAGKNVQITSKLLGSEGALEVVGGRANKAQAYIIGESGVATDTSGTYLELKIPAFPDTFNRGDIVRIENDAGVKRFSRLLDTDSITVTIPSANTVEYNYNSKATNFTSSTTFTIVDVSASYGRPAGIVWRWTHGGGGASLADVIPGDLVTAFGTLSVNWSQGNKARISGDGRVSGLPIINVNDGANWFDVVNPSGRAMVSTSMGTGTIQINPTPIIKWNLAHAAPTQILSITRITNVVTVNTSTAHLLNTGDTVQLIDSDNLSDGAYVPVTVITATQFTLASAGTDFSEVNVGASITNAATAHTRYRIERLDFNGLTRLSRQDGNSPRFTDVGVAVDDYIVISGETFHANNNGRFLVLAVDENSVLFINSQSTDEINTAQRFNNKGFLATWTTNSNLVIGVAGTFKNVAVGDWVKKEEDPEAFYRQVTSMNAAATIATQITLGNNYTGNSSIAAGIAYDQLTGYDQGVFLNDAEDVAFYEGDSIVNSDTLFIQNIVNASWFSVQNTGSFQVVESGTNGVTFKPFIRILNPAGISETNRLMSVDTAGFYIVEGLNSKFYTYRQIEHAVIDGLNDERRILFLTPSSRSYKFSEANLTSIVHSAKLGYNTDVTIGVDGYLYYTGLLRRVQRTVDGFEPDAETFPGRRAVGSFIETLPPLIKNIIMAINVTTDEGVNLGDISSNISSTIISYVQSLGVGEDVILSEIIASIMQIKGVAAVTFTNPIPSTERITIASNEKSIIVTENIGIA